MKSYITKLEKRIEGLEEGEGEYGDKGRESGGEYGD